MNFLNKIKLYIFAHKIISIIVLVIIIFAGRSIYTNLTGTTGEIRYVLSPVTKNTIIASVAGSGQVSVLNQIAISPTVSGTLTAVYAKPGDKVGSGQTLFVIDDANAQKTVRDAEINL
jgi:macrolide-specific efflux system membrane fusion protein